MRSLVVANRFLASERDAVALPGRISGWNLGVAPALTRNGNQLSNTYMHRHHDNQLHHTIPQDSHKNL